VCVPTVRVAGCRLLVPTTGKPDFSARGSHDPTTEALSLGASSIVMDAQTKQERSEFQSLPVKLGTDDTRPTMWLSGLSVHVKG